MADFKLEEVDLYELLGIELKADASEIKKAYRKKALQCHPDKNPDNPKAAELFHQLSKALEILVDASARAAYDKVLNAKKAAKLRHKELNAKRQKLIDDLERREKAAELKAKGYKTYDEKTDEERLQAEIQRLQKEGSRLLEEEQEKMKQQIFAEAERISSTSGFWDASSHRIRIKWSSKKDDPQNGGYNEEVLRHILKKYGDINVLVISKKNGSALVEFTTKEAVDMALDFEKGLKENPLSLTLLKNEQASSNTLSSNKPADSTTHVTSERDYESLVMRKLRQAAERQKLIEDMMKEEGS